MAPKQAFENEKELDRHRRGESQVRRHRSVKEPGGGGGGGRMRNSARGDEAENAGKGYHRAFFRKSKREPGYDRLGSLITFGCCPVNTAALNSD